MLLGWPHAVSEGFGKHVLGSPIVNRSAKAEALAHGVGLEGRAAVEVLEWEQDQQHAKAGVPGGNHYSIGGKGMGDFECLQVKRCSRANEVGVQHAPVGHVAA